MWIYREEAVIGELGKLKARGELNSRLSCLRKTTKLCPYAEGLKVAVYNNARGH